jgi:hypothetical protein
MATKTSQQITKYYETYKNIDVTFNNAVIQMTGLLPKLISFKVGSNQIPCIIYSSSMIEAKMVAVINQAMFERIREAHNIIAVNFVFRRQGKAAPLKFFVPAKIIGISPYNSGKKETNFVSISFLQKPPDDLIEILGSLLDIKTNAKQRSEERIPINETNKRKLGLTSKDVFVLIEGIPRKCIPRDLSFSGGKVILVGIARFLLQKNASLKLHFDNSLEPLELKGVIIRCEEVNGRKDLIAVAIQFTENEIPIEYTKRITDFFG